MFGGIIVVIILIIMICSWLVSNILLKPKKRLREKLFQREIDNGRLMEDLYQSWSKKDFTIRSRYGYNLSCQMINNEISEKQYEQAYGKIRFAIICHGFSCDKSSSMMYAELFLKRGITVIAYDQRNHGLSGSALTSMGYYEKFDLQTIVDWCFEKYGTNISIVTHGEAMGAATVLTHLAIDGRVRCAISDCSFSNLKQVVNYQLKNYYHIPKIPFLPIARLLIKMRADFWIEDVVPIDGVIQSNAPILFIHGQEDKYIPSSMSKEMYDEKADKKEL